MKYTIYQEMKIVFLLCYPSEDDGTMKNILFHILQGKILYPVPLHNQ